MGRPVRHTPEEWKAIERQKAFWGTVRAILGAGLALIILVALAIKIIPTFFGFAMALTGIYEPSFVGMLVVSVVAALLLIVALFFR